MRDRDRGERGQNRNEKIRGNKRERLRKTKSAELTKRTKREEVFSFFQIGFGEETLLRLSSSPKENFSLALTLEPKMKKMKKMLKMKKRSSFSSC